MSACYAEEDRQNYFASCAKGLEDLLAKELQSLNAGDLKVHPGGVSFQATKKVLYRICLWSHLANQVQKQLIQTRIKTAQDLYQSVYKIGWPDYFDVQKTFKINVSGKHHAFNDTRFAAQKAKDAVVDKFRHSIGTRPDISTISAEIVIQLHFYKGMVTVLLSASGESLHRRGYRTQQASAPLKETLAAAMLLRAGWRTKLQESAMPVLLDPMCGSGTILIEAAMMAFKIAPNLNRTQFSFMQWQDYDQDLFQSLVQEAVAQRETKQDGAQTKIIGYDYDPSVVEKARANIASAGLSHAIEVKVQEIKRLKSPSDNGLIVTNPPYGERLYHGQEARLNTLFHNFGEMLFQNFQGWKVAVLSASKTLTKAIGMRSTKYNKFYNGAIETILFHFTVNEKALMQYESEAEKLKRQAESAVAVDDGHLAFSNRLGKNLQRLIPWAKQQSIECYRVYDGDIPEYSAAIDLYHRYVHIQAYQIGKGIDSEIAKKHLRQMVYHIHHTFEIPYRHIYLKTRQRQSGKQQYEKQNDQNRFQIVREGKALFYVNFSDYLDTGLFLDHRKIRSLIAKKSHNKRLLNLFSYTCTASVHAALNQAREITNVDMSKTYLDWGKRNFELNRLQNFPVNFIQAEAISWLKATAQSRQKYDVIFLDPPTFSNSKRMQNVLDIQWDHPMLIGLAMKLLAKNGVLYFSNNYRKFKLDETVARQYQCDNIDALCLSRDFLRRPNVHHCWEIRRQ